MQKREVRIIAGLKSLDSYRPYFIKFKQLTAQSLYTFEAILVAKEEGFKNNADTYKYDTRNRDSRYVEVHRPARYECKPNFIGTKMFNTFPLELRLIQVTEIIRSSLKEYLIKKCFYSLEEFLSPYHSLMDVFLTCPILFRVSLDAWKKLI